MPTGMSCDESVFNPTKTLPPNESELSSPIPMILTFLEIDPTSAAIVYVVPLTVSVPDAGAPRSAKY